MLWCYVGALVARTISQTIRQSYSGELTYMYPNPREHLPRLQSSKFKDHPRTQLFLNSICLNNTVILQRNQWLPWRLGRRIASEVTPIRTAKSLSILHTCSPCRVAGPSLSIGQRYAPDDEAFQNSALACLLRLPFDTDDFHCTTPTAARSCAWPFLLLNLGWPRPPKPTRPLGFDHGCKTCMRL